MIKKIGGEIMQNLLESLINIWVILIKGFKSLWDTSPLLFVFSMIGLFSVPNKRKRA